MIDLVRSVAGAYTYPTLAGAGFIVAFVAVLLLSLVFNGNARRAVRRSGGTLLFAAALGAGAVGYYIDGASAAPTTVDTAAQQ